MPVSQIPRFSPEQVQDVLRDPFTLSQAVHKIAQLVQSIPGVTGVKLCFMEKEIGSPDVRDNSPVIVADTALLAQSLVKFAELYIFDIAAASWRAEHLTERIFNGPMMVPGGQVAQGKSCLVLYFESKRDLWWVWLFSTAQAFDPSAQLAIRSCIAELLQTFSEQCFLQEKSVRHDRRQTFYESLLRIAPRNPDTDLPAICEAWRSVNGADWVWFWLYNGISEPGEWELVAGSPQNAKEFVPAQLTAPEDNSVAEYCCQKGEPVLVTDLDNWHQSFEGKTYRVVCRQDLKDMGCKSFEAIPLPPVIRIADAPALKMDAQLFLKGVICIHYKHDYPEVRQPMSSLLLMGRLTARSVVNSYEAEQREILVELNTLAEKYLTRVSRNPQEIRAEYLQEVIILIKTRLHVGAVSVFYKDFSEERAICLATTGLCDAAGKRIENASISDVSYRAGEGLTGMCFALGKPIVLAATKHPAHTAKYFEMPQDVPIRNSAVIFYPISSPGAVDGSDKPTAANGVIRCTDHRSPQFQGHSRGFDSVEIQTLSFIAGQVGPVLQTMAVNIQREQTINIVKHDLFAPMRMIMDAAEEVDEALQGHKVDLGPHTLDNLVTAAMVQSALVLQLDPDPSEVRRFDPQLTNLEGDIVARLKKMLSHYAYGENQMTIRFADFQDIVPKLYVDRTLIERALNNLIINAIKYGKRGTNITISPRRTDAGFYVDVINHGMGIEPEDEPHIFKAHYRSSRAKERKLGSGLGLTIAKRAMEKHGGRLILTAPRDPTVFSLFFPKKLVRTNP